MARRQRTPGSFKEARDASPLPPVRRDLDQLKHQANDLLRALHAGDPAFVAEFREHHRDPIDRASVKLADAPLVLARSYRTTSWTRLVQAARLATAIWSDDLDAVRDLVTGNPSLIREPVLIRTDSQLRAAHDVRGDPLDATVGTPLGGSTLLHMGVDYDELRSRAGCWTGGWTSAPAPPWGATASAVIRRPSTRSSHNRTSG